MTDYTNGIEQLINNKSNYIADAMQKFSVDDITYSNYSEYTFAWEKSYVKSPTRSGDGAMGNLDTYSTFVTPHMTAKYTLISIDDYRSIMKQYLEKNEFTVTCYDPIYDKETTNIMYFATPSTPTFWYVDSTDADGNATVSLVGVRDFTVELIGTNREA